MGVPVRIVLYAGDRGFAESAARAAFARIAQLDRMMSDYRPDSELRQIEEHAGEPVRVSAELFDVVSRASEIARATGSAFDPTVAPLVRLWREARVNRLLPDSAALERARTAVGWRRLELYPSTSSIRLQPGMRLDLGGIAKGYILQEALKTMRGADVTRVMVEAGGDLVVGEPPPGRPGWHIATPEADLDFARRASALKNAALATSGPTAQFVEIDGVRYSHVVDPRTGMALTREVVAYVIAADGATADALATALTVLGKEAAGTVIVRFPEAISSILSRYSASGPSRVEKSAKRGQAP
jgi:thiamine biosynthesis lipoprotein